MKYQVTVIFTFTFWFNLVTIIYYQIMNFRYWISKNDSFHLFWIYPKYIMVKITWTSTNLHSIYKIIAVATIITKSRIWNRNYLYIHSFSALKFVNLFWKKTLYQIIFTFLTETIQRHQRYIFSIKINTERIHIFSLISIFLCNQYFPTPKQKHRVQGFLCNISFKEYHLNK